LEDPASENPAPGKRPALWWHDYGRPAQTAAMRVALELLTIAERHAYG
jgi:hypothetical protein